MSDHLEGAGVILARLLQLAELHDSEGMGLRGEYERWKMRFELLAPVAVCAN